MKIAIIRYNAGNVQSVKFALDRIGVDYEVTDDHEAIRTADKVIFPGVGEASTAMQYLKEKGLDQLIPGLKQPVLGICLGMQLMCQNSEENDTDCLNIFPVPVKKFEIDFKVPHVGWNRLHDWKTPLFEGMDKKTFVYFVHSYYVPLCAQTIATADYGIEFSAALQHNNFYGVQFHPEKSSEVGEQILRNFIQKDL